MIGKGRDRGRVRHLLKDEGESRTMRERYSTGCKKKKSERKRESRGRGKRENERDKEKTRSVSYSHLAISGIMTRELE